MGKQEDAVRNYLTAIKKPSELIDASKISELKAELERSQDPVARVQLRQQIVDAEKPALAKYEDDFVTHAKAWADKQGISAEALAAEGVETKVLRKAGFKVVQPAVAGRRRTPSRTRVRVSSEEVRKAIPKKGTFRIKDIQDKTGASAAVVRRVVQTAEEEGKISKKGTDPDHKGPGRAAMIYEVA